MFTGSIAALVTPFTEQGDIDFQSFDALIEWHIAEGTDALVLFGTTGEAPTLSVEEKEALCTRAKAVARGRIPLIAGTGTNSTATSIQQTKMALHAKMDACLAVIPYYNRPSLEGCYLHFQAIAEVGLPVILYYHPGRTGTTLSPQSLAHIASLPGIIAIKEASGDARSVEALMRLTDKDVLSGDDGLCVELMRKGARGVISVVANVVPRQWKALCTAALQGDAKADALFCELKELCDALFLETNPQCVKYALSLMGKCTSHVRLPLVEPKESTKARVGLYTQGK